MSSQALVDIIIPFFIWSSAMLNPLPKGIQLVCGRGGTEIQDFWLENTIFPCYLTHMPPCVWMLVL